MEIVLLNSQSLSVKNRHYWRLSFKLFCFFDLHFLMRIAFFVWDFPVLSPRMYGTYDTMHCSLFCKISAISRMFFPDEYRSDTHRKSGESNFPHVTRIFRTFPVLILYFNAVPRKLFVSMYVFAISSKFILPSIIYFYLCFSIPLLLLFLALYIYPSSLPCLQNGFLVFRPGKKAYHPGCL